MTDVQLNYLIILTGILALIIAIISTEFSEKQKKKREYTIRKNETIEKIKKAKKIPTIIIESPLDSKIRNQKTSKKGALNDK